MSRDVIRLFAPLKLANTLRTNNILVRISLIRLRAWLGLLFAPPHCSLRGLEKWQSTTRLQPLVIYFCPSPRRQIETKLGIFKYLSELVPQNGSA